MVQQQRPKRTLRTGNIKLQEMNKKHGHGFIIRQSTQSSNPAITEAVDDAFIADDGVAYSLNKKGRWDLPDLIDRKIRNDSFDDDVNVSLLYRYRVNQQNYCFKLVSSAATNGDLCFPLRQRKKAQRKMHCNGLNVLTKGRRQPLSEKRAMLCTKDLAQWEEGTNTAKPELIPQVQYNVVYEIPVSSSLCFQTKFNTAVPFSEQRPVLKPGIKFINGSRHRNKHGDFNKILCDDDFYEDWDYDEEDGCQDTELDEDVGEFTVQRGSENELLFSDVLEQAIHARSTRDQPVKRKKSRKHRFSQTGRKHLLDELRTVSEPDPYMEISSEISSDSDSSFTEVAIPRAVSVTPIPSVTVTLLMDAVHKPRLRELYGEYYTEAQCNPRKIVINITDRVKGILKSVDAFCDAYLPSLDLTTYVVLTYTGPATQHGKTKDECPSKVKDIQNTDIVDNTDMEYVEHVYTMFRMQLNTICQGRGNTIKLSPQTQPFDDLECLLQLVLKEVVPLSPEGLLCHPSQTIPCALELKSKPTFDTLAKANGWKATCVSLVDKQAEKCFSAIIADSSCHTAAEPTRTNPQTFSLLNYSACSKQTLDVISEELFFNNVPGNLYCGICFEELSPECPENDHCTALTQCQHWFCDTCWQSHLSTMARKSVGRQLQCPAFGCEAEVDVGTALSLLHVSEVNVHQRRCLETKVTTMAISKWCPNPNCGRVIQLPAPRLETVAQPTSMLCSCGQRFCFRCLQDAHWPMSCDDFQLYYATLQAHGNVGPGTQYDVIGTSVQKGKYCPNCSTFIVKNGGCPSMVCAICNCNFYWCCLQYTSLGHRCEDYYRFGKNLKKFHVKTVQRTHPINSSALYKMAVDHRMAHYSKQARRDYKRAVELQSKLYVLYTKNVHIGCPMSVTGCCNSAVASTVPDKEHANDVVSTVDRKIRTHPATTPRYYTHTVNTAHGNVKQYLQQTTVGIVKLKLELHHVIENTVALLYLREDDQGAQETRHKTFRNIKDSLDHLLYLLTCVDSHLNAKSRPELVIVLPDFRTLQQDAMYTFSNLAFLTKSV